MNKQKPLKPEAESQDISSLENVVRNIASSQVVNKHGKTIVYGAVILALAAAVLISQMKNWKEKDYDRNKVLGPAYVYFSGNQMDSAEVFLQNFLQDSRDEVVESKAYLLLGRAQYSLKKYPEALDTFGKVKGNGREFDLLGAGALYGRAACYMQLGQYESAVETLEKFVTGNMKKGMGEDKFIPDQSPSIPGALWKQALCYHQLKDNEKTRQSCEKLIKYYSGSEEAGKASRLMLSI